MSRYNIASNENLLVSYFVTDWLSQVFMSTNGVDKWV